MSTILIVLLLNLCYKVIYSTNYSVHSIADYPSNFEDFVLFCPLRGALLSFTWLRNNKTLYRGRHPLDGSAVFSLKNESYSLVVSNASLLQEGQYVCKKDVDTIVEYNLVIKVKPQNFYMNINEKTLSDGDHIVLDADMIITVSCHVTRVRPKVNIAWKFDDETALSVTHNWMKSKKTDAFNVSSKIHHLPKAPGGNITCNLQSPFENETEYTITVQYSTESRSPLFTVSFTGSDDRPMLPTSSNAMVIATVSVILLCVAAFAFSLMYIKGLPMECRTESSTVDDSLNVNVPQDVEMNSNAPKDKPETMSYVMKNIQRENVILKEQLTCNGAMVYWIATCSSPQNDDKFKFIAKSVSDTAQVSDMKNFHDVAKQLTTLTAHHNIVDVFGTAIDNLPYYIYQEYVECGTLRNFLFRNYQSEGKRLGNNNSSENSPKGSSSEQKELIQFALDVIDGMVHLSEHKFRHPCMRISKVLVDNAGNCKLYDFTTEGLAKEKLLQIIGKRASPTAWLSPEFIFLRQYCEKADVWSFGVALWEIFSLGDTPYSGLSGEEIETEIRNAKYLAQPMCCPGSIFGIMLSCWDNSPSARPSFQELQQNLRELCTVTEEASVDINGASESVYVTLDDTAS